MLRVKIVEIVRTALLANDYILNARMYGSWLFSSNSADMDIAIHVAGERGIIESEVYYALCALRNQLCEQTKCDIDIVPHTTDEFDDYNSPLWSPRHNPSIVFGQDLKGIFPVTSSSILSNKFSFADLTARVLHDNRTVCRRQLIRSLNSEEARIYVSKLRHGPGNVLTYLACREGVVYKYSPSDFLECFEVFDSIYYLNSQIVADFFLKNQVELDLSTGITIMNWYENLLGIVFNGRRFKSSYQEACKAFENINKRIS